MKYSAYLSAMCAFNRKLVYLGTELTQDKSYTPNLQIQCFKAKYSAIISVILILVSSIVNVS